MTSTYLPIEPFDIEYVRFYVHGSSQPLQGMLAPVYRIIGMLTGRQPIALELVAQTDQETAGTLSTMEMMEKYGEKYLHQARKIAYKQGYLVTNSKWGGIIDSDNLSVLQNSPTWFVWEFPLMI